MFLTRKEIRQHIEAIADAMFDCEPETWCCCDHSVRSERMGDLIAELYTLAEDIYPTCTEDTDEDAIREAVREAQYANRW